MVDFKITKIIDRNNPNVVPIGNPTKRIYKTINKHYLITIKGVLMIVHVVIQVVFHYQIQEIIIVPATGEKQKRVDCRVFL